MNKANRIIFVLSIAGLLISLYLLEKYTSQSSIVCLSGEGCDIVRKSIYAYPFGIPMPVFGITGFITTAILSFLLTLNLKIKRVVILSLLAISLFGFGFVVYLTSLEAFVIKAYCTWCLTVAFLQAAIFFLSIYIWINTKNEPRI